MENSKTKIRPPVDRQAGLSLLAGLMVLAVIGIVVTVVANYFM